MGLNRLSPCRKFGTGAEVLRHRQVSSTHGLYLTSLNIVGSHFLALLLLLIIVEADVRPI
jgi:hypothetical protein